MIEKKCTKCVMDNTDPDITFDENGVCNHCNEAFSKIPTYKFTSLQPCKFGIPEVGDL